jgi:hypothetical protein
LVPPEEMEGHMLRPITVAIAFAMTSFLALMLWQVDRNATAGSAGARPKPEYAVTSNPYLPIKRLGPVY